MDCILALLSGPGGIQWNHMCTLGSLLTIPVLHKLIQMNGCTKYKATGSSRNGVYNFTAISKIDKIDEIMPCAWCWKRSQSFSYLSQSYTVWYEIFTGIGIGLTYFTQCVVLSYTDIARVQDFYIA